MIILVLFHHMKENEVALQLVEMRITWMCDVNRLTCGEQRERLVIDYLTTLIQQNRLR